ncbi:ribonuclease H-like domain-containing protein [Tanacetum coccineum]
MAGEAEFHDDNTPPPPPPVTPTQQALTLCQLLNSLFRRMGNGPVQVLTDTNGQIKVLPPKTAKEILARERERQSKNHLAYGYTRRPFSKVEMINLKECRKYIFKQQFESFSVSNSEGLHKGYNRFQSLLSQLEIHGASVSNEDANQKFLKSLPTSWSQKFYKKTGRRLQFDAKEPVGFDKTKVECFNCHNTWHFARECRSKGNQESRRRDAGNTRYKAKDNGRRPGKQEEPKSLVTLDGEGIDWTGHAEDEPENFALMAYSNSGSDTEMSTRDKSGLGYGNQIHEGVLSYEKEVLESVFDSRSSDVEDSPVNDRFAKVESKTSESDAKTSDFDSCETNSNVETLESVPEPVVVEPKVVSQPKVWSDSPIIEEYESDSDDEYAGFGIMVFPLKGNAFVCGSFSHLIRDCDFHEKRMAKQFELNKKKVNTARQNLSSQAAETSTARKVNTARLILVLLGAIGKLLLRPQQVVIGDPKDITGTKSPNTIVDQTLGDPQVALKDTEMFDSGCLIPKA